MAERSVVVIYGLSLRSLGVRFDSNRRFHGRIITLDSYLLRSERVKFQATFADGYDVILGKRALYLNISVYKDVVDAADKLAVFQMAVDHLKHLAVAENKCVLARNAPVVEDNVVLARSSD